jgi:uncharacterized membrane protein YeaQ/YmgE (transglycosylase-associated protein family)
MINNPSEGGGRTGARTDMSFVAWIAVGAVAGLLANVIYPDPSKGGVIGAVLLGVVGALLGGWLGGLVMKRDMTTGINVPTIAISVVGALLALFLWNAVF